MSCLQHFKLLQGQVWLEERVLRRNGVSIGWTVAGSISTDDAEEVQRQTNEAEQAPPVTGLE